ncbi:MAG: tetratricopeptide repeat protein, partial [Gammaproteobacteria bacterium]
MDSSGDTLDQERRRLEADCAAHPADPDRRFRLGEVCLALGCAGDAARHYAAVAAQAPERAAPRGRLGLALHRLGREEEAILAYRAALALKPADPETHFNLAALYAARREGGPAVAHYEAAIAADPAGHRAYLGMGNVLLAMGDPTGARRAFAGALRNGAPSGVRFLRDLCLPVIAVSGADLSAARTAFEIGLGKLESDPPPLGHPAREGGGPRFYLAYQGRDDRALQERLARLYLSACPGLHWVAPHCRAPRLLPPVRRIGVVSRYLFDHSIGRLMQGLLAHLAGRGGCEIVLFDVTPAPDDALRRDLVRHADRVERLDGDLVRQREQIGRAELDILFYPDIGMDYATYFLAFARLAPVQCVTWGHPVTTGIPTIDYFLSCALAEPADAPAHYSERLIRLGGLPFSYRRPPRPASTKTRADFGLEDAWHVYFLAQNLFKIHPDMDVALRRILEDDPLARVVLIEGHYPTWGEILRRRFAESLGSAANRVVFLPRLGHDDFMRMLALADVSLDSFPFCGGNTTYQALAMGTPVVTLPGDFLRGRLSLAILCALGVTETIAMNADEYARIAVRLTTDGDWAAYIAGRIEAGAPDIFDDPVFLEDAAEFLL